MPLALSMEAHYRELKLSGKQIIAKKGHLLVIHIKTQLLFTLIHSQPLKRALIDAPPPTRQDLDAIQAKSRSL